MHLSVLIPALLWASTIYIVYTIYTYVRSSDRYIPGPFLSNFTRLWYFNRVRLGNFHHENISLHDQYGPIVRVAPGYYSIAQPDKIVYGIGSKFPKGEWYQGWKHPSPERWTLFPDQDMKRHADTRKRFQGLYSMSSLLSYESYVEHCIGIFDEKLSTFAQTGESIDLAHWFQCYAFDVIGMITYSERFGFLDYGKDIAGVITALDRSMVYSTLIGIFPHLHRYLYAILERIPGTGAAGRTYLMKFVQQKIDERNILVEKADSKVSSDVTAPQDFLDKITQARRQNPDKISQYHIFMMGLSNIIAGSDTTAVSLSSVLYHLITTPDALEKLRQEIARHVSSGNMISFQESQKMPYLQAVIKEALRMHPATGLPLWRVVPQGGVEIAGHRLSEGTNVGINSWVAHNDQSVYGGDAAIFRPERWIEAKEQDEARHRLMETNFMPFGLGSRTCLGRHISMLEMCKLLPDILMKYEFELAMPASDWKTTNYWFVKPDKLYMCLKKRIEKV